MKKLNILAICMLLLALVIFRGNYDNPRNASTGAPGEGLCTDCHTESGNINGVLELAGLPGEIVQGETYELSITTRYLDGNALTAGFQIVILDERDENAGMMSRPGGANSGIITSSGRTYFEHKIGPTKLRSDSTVTWTVEWIAPEGNLGDKISLYGAGILADGDSTASNDKQITNVISGFMVEAASEFGAELDVTDITCFGANDGKITVNVVGGTAPYSYDWDHGASTSSLQDLQPGEYNVTVADNDTNMIVLQASLTEPDSLAVNLVEKGDIFCTGINTGYIEVAVVGGEAPYTYLWSNGGNLNKINNLAAGTYQLAITDNRGCLALFETEISQSNALSLQLAATDESAPGTADGSVSVVPQGGIGPYLIVWNTGDTSSIVQNLNPGIYTVIVSDQNGCISQGSITVNPGNCALELQSTVINISCFGDQDGSIEIMAINGTGDIEYQWSNLDSTAQISNLDKGDYSVTVTDAAGCQLTQTFNLTEPAPLEVMLVSKADAQCESGSDGFIQIEVIGGTPPYQLLWSNGMVDSDIKDLRPGIYVVQVSDSLACDESLTVTISADDNLPPEPIFDDVIVYLDGSGLVDISIDQLDAGSRDNCGLDTMFLDRTNFSCEDIGTVTLAATLIDLSGNMTVDSISLTIRDTIAPMVECLEGILSRNCDGVTYPLPVASDNCAIDTFILVDGLGSGSVFPIGSTKEEYLILDKNGNSVNCTFSVIVETDIEISFMGESPSCFGEKNGVLSTTITGGKGAVSLIWSTGATGDIVDSLGAGSYYVTATDSEGCFAVDSFQLEDPDTMQITLENISNVTDGALGAIDISVIGGMEPYTFVWLFGGDTIGMSEDLIELQPGIYEVLVIDANNCRESRATFTVESMTTSIQILEGTNVVKVFPNPFQKQLNVELLSDVQIEEVYFVTMEGRHSRIQNVHQSGSLITINEAVQKGIYFLHIVTDQGVIVEKVVAH